MSVVATRATDEMVLAWVKARAKGETSYAIAKAWGVDPARVRSDTGRVVKDDMAKSGEPRAEVAKAYWGAG